MALEAIEVGAQAQLGAVRESMRCIGSANLPAPTMNAVVKSFGERKLIRNDRRQRLSFCGLEEVSF